MCEDGSCRGNRTVMRFNLVAFLVIMAGGGDRTTMQLRTRSTMVARAIQKVIQAIPADPEECWTFEAHLSVMGCVGLLDVAWGVKEDALETKLMGSPDNRYFGSLQAHPRH